MVFALIGMSAVAYGYHPLFIHDSWLMAGLYEAWKSGDLGLAFLWSQHNEHRILSLRVILGLDLFLERGRGYFILGLIFLLQALHVGLMWKVIGRDRRLDAATKSFLLGVAIFFFFWLRQRENFVWIFQIAWILQAFLISVAAYLVAGLDEIPLNKPARRFWVFSLAAFVSLVITTTLASGLLVPIVLAVLIWKSNVTRAAFWGWILFAIALGAAFLAGYVSPSYHSQPREALAVDTILYLMLYLGNPIVIKGIPLYVALVPGLVVLGLYLWFTFQFLRCQSPAFLDKFVFVISTQMMLMAGTTAVGRHTLGLDQASSGRYTTPVLILWFTLLVWGAVRWTDRPFVLAWVKRGLVLLVVMFVLPTQALLASRTIQRYQKHDETSLALMAGVEDTTATNRSFIVPNELWPLNETARRHGLSVYRDEWTRWSQTSLSAVALIDTAENVRGVIFDRRAVGTLERSGYYIGGRVSSESGVTATPFETYVLTRDDSIVGYARTTKRRCGGCFTGYVRGSGGFDLHGVQQRQLGHWRATYIP